MKKRRGAGMGGPEGQEEVRRGHERVGAGCERVRGHERVEGA